MSPVPDLDEELHAKVLEFVTEPRACISCQSWKKKLYPALQLDYLIQFNKRVNEEGQISFCYQAVRPLGEDFEESVGYYFKFAKDGTYSMQWTRTFDAWSSQSEQQFGQWRIYMEFVLCETLAPPQEVSDREVRYAPPGYKFQMPINDILCAKDGYFQVADGARAAPWELPARTGKMEEKSSVWTPGMWQREVAAPPPSPAPRTDFQAPYRADARFVEIDGEMHEVSGDIVANWPEHDWARLMRCRLRWGIVG